MSGSLLKFGQEAFLSLEAKFSMQLIEKAVTLGTGVAEDSQGRHYYTPAPPEEVVDRCMAIAKVAVRKMADAGWISVMEPKEE